MDTKNKKGYQACIENGWLSTIQRNSISHATNPIVRELKRLFNGDISSWDIRQYCYHMNLINETTKEFINQGSVIHPWDLKYPNFKDFEIDKEILKQDTISKITRPKKKMEKLNIKQILDKDPTMDIYKILFSPQSINPPQNNITLFRGMETEEMLKIKTSEEFIELLKAPMGTMNLLSYKKDAIQFKDKKWITADNLLSENNYKNYAVRKITDTVYYAYFASGCLRIEL